MDALSDDATVGAEDPRATDLDLLFARHAAHCAEMTPICARHMLSREALSTGADLVVLRAHGRPLAMGALAPLGAGHGELKSMHVLSEARGRGFGRRILDRLVAEARARGWRRLSLETGATVNFAAARALYAAAGFTSCPPFAGYRADPNSVFMTRALNG